MFELPTSQLPSRGLIYTEDRLEMRPLGIPEMMLISEAIENNDDAPFVKAIQSTTNISTPLTVGDFYFLAAIQRVITFKKSPIVWEWSCSGTLLTVNLQDVEIDADLVKFLSDTGFKQITETQYKLMDSSRVQAAVAGLEAYKGQYRGSLDYCELDNSVPITPDLLCESITQIAENVVLDDHYHLPTVTTIPEYKKLATDERLRKLLPLVSWLDDSLGKTLAERIDNLSRATDGMDVLDKASAYDILYQHGLKRDIVCPPCAQCGARTDTQRFPVTAQSFYRR